MNNKLIGDHFIGGIYLAKLDANRTRVLTTATAYPGKKPIIKFPGGMYEPQIDAKNTTWSKDVFKSLEHYQYSDTFMDRVKDVLKKMQLDPYQTVLVRKFLMKTGLFPIKFNLIHTQEVKNVKQYFYYVTEVTEPGGRINVADIQSRDSKIKERPLFSIYEVYENLCWTHQQPWLQLEKLVS